MFRMKDKVAIVTGASSGIGAAVAKEFAKEGGILVLTGRNEENLRKTAEECTPAKTSIIKADMTVEEDVNKIVEETLKEFERIDVLINNAGILKIGSIFDTSLEQYDRVMNVNMRSVYHLTMLCVPHLVKSKGVIVNVSSVNGIRSFPGVLAYNISKSALDQFTRCIALELAPKQVRVNSVNPGVVVTEIQKRGGLDDEQYEKFLERSKSTHALGRVGQPEEVAKAVLYLASEDSSFITGATLPIDGGRHAMCPR